MTRTLAAAMALLAVAGCSGKDGARGRAAAPNAVRIVATASSETRGPLVAFHSRKQLRPPAVTVGTGPAEGTSPGLIFLTPRAADPDHPSGPTILDSRGRLVWFRPRPGRVTSDLTPQTFKGQRILTWGERPPVTTPSEIFTTDPEQVYFVFVDQRYNELLKLRAIGEGVGTDMHELVVTKKNTALLLGFRTVTRDISTLGGRSAEQVVDSIVQEIDLTTGKLLLNWSALDHIPLSDSMFPLPKKEAWDPYHANSVAVTSDGNLLVSMRHTSAVYKIDRRSGKVLWTLGGKSSDFEVDNDAAFHFQHDVQPLGNGELLMFDNGATLADRRAPYSRVMRLKLDGATGRLTLLKEIVHEPAILAVSQGNARVTKSGNIFVGWGNRQWFSEYTPEGQQLFDAALPSVAYQSYRAVKGDWVGRPASKPAVVADRLRGRTLIWVSWNGATQVTRWRVLGGAGETTLRRLGSAAKQGFETRLDVAAAPRVVRVQALGRDGKVLATSLAVRPG